MDKYIKREALYKELETWRDAHANIVDGYGRKLLEDVLWAVNAQPGADVAPVRHGHWEFLGPNSLNRNCMCGTCSACHVRSVYIVNTAICPNCGASMGKGGRTA